MYNFLSLTNDVNNRFNEVPLTSSTFSGTTGYYSTAKSAVNHAIGRINRQKFEWPFNHQREVLTLTPEQAFYSNPADFKTIAFDSFLLRGDDTLNNETAKLKIIDYEELTTRKPEWVVDTVNTASIPVYVCRGRALEFGIFPAPDQAYTIDYEYYSLPTDLEDWDDVPTIPENFKWVIIEGAMHYAYMFRGDAEAAQISNALFEQGLKDMCMIYINRYEYARSTMLTGA